MRERGDHPEWIDRRARGPRLPSGQTMHAGAGDWEVRSTGDETWSVRDDIFRSAHDHIDGTRWRRNGVAQARKAHPGHRNPGGFVDRTGRGLGQLRIRR